MMRTVHVLEEQRWQGVCTRLMRRVGRLRVHVTALLIVSSTACSPDPQTFADRRTTAQERDFPRQYMDLLATSQIDSAYTLLAPELIGEDSRKQLTIVGQMLANSNLDSLILVGVHIYEVDDQRMVNFTYLTTMTSGWIIANVATRRNESSVYVNGFSGQSYENSPIEMASFSMSDRYVYQYLWLIVPLLIIPTCLVCSVIVWRTAGMKRRRVWALAAFLCAPIIALNWSTGAVDIRPISVLVLGFAVSKASPVSPWIFSIGLPVGAMVAMARRAAWLQRKNSAERAEESTRSLTGT